MGRLIESDFASAGQAHGSLDAPFGLFDLGASDSFARQGSHGGVEVITHQIKHCAQDVVIGVPLDKRRWGG
jgi:hypothetical protein